MNPRFFLGLLTEDRREREAAGDVRRCNDGSSSCAGVENGAVHCAGTETGEPSACIHGGPLRRVTTTEASCAVDSVAP